MSAKLKTQRPTASSPSARLRSELDQARRLLEAGQIVEAAFAYEACLMRRPGLAEALYGMGLCALQRGELEAARRYATQATEADPSRAPGWHLLGRAYKRLAQPVEAERCFQRAIETAPGHVEARIHLGILLRGRGELGAAAEQYRAALRRQPGSFEALVNLANVLADLNEHEEAIRHFQRAIALRPDASDAVVNLAKLLMRLERLDDAVTLLSEAQQRAPSDGRIVRELGTAYEGLGDLAAAGAAYHKAATLMPNDLRAHLLLGEVGLKLRAHADCVTIYRRCLEIEPDDPSATNNLSVVLRMEERPGEALALARRAVQLKPDMVEAHASVADALSSLGRSAEADAVYREAMSRFPDHILSNFLLTSNYVDTLTPEELLARHRQVGERYRRLVPPAITHGNGPDPHRSLRVGYLSGDFRAHSVAYFIEPILLAHDPDRVHIACYHTQGAADAVTARLERHARVWVQAERMSDDALAQRIRDDQIDILVDLSGHTAGNRLFAVARKPAPVQVSYLGYPTTTGLAAMDYRISDWQVDPPGSEAMNTEAVVRLPDSYYCFTPPPAPDLVTPPALRRGFVTFGSFNNMAKISDTAVSLWAAALHAVPASRLLLKTRGLSDPACREGLIARFAAHGIEAGRVSFEGWTRAREGHLALYNEVDIALDTYPYNGGTTTCEALWMGVPVVSMCGATHASRMGMSLLRAAGLSDLVALDAPAYVRIAAGLASDLERLASLRAGMRTQLSRSALMDASRFTRALEEAYRDMWQRWCWRS